MLFVFTNTTFITLTCSERKRRYFFQFNVLSWLAFVFSFGWIFFKDVSELQSGVEQWEFKFMHTMHISVIELKTYNFFQFKSMQRFSWIHFLFSFLISADVGFVFFFFLFILQHIGTGTHSNIRSSTVVVCVSVWLSWKFLISSLGSGRKNERLKERIIFNYKKNKRPNHPPPRPPQSNRWSEMFFKKW